MTSNPTIHHINQTIMNLLQTDTAVTLAATATPMTLALDTSDGKHNSDADLTCDGCEKVDRDGLHLICWEFEPTHDDPPWRPTLGPRPAEQMVERLIAPVTKPRAIVTIGLCDDCIKSADDYVRTLKAHRN